MIALPRLSGALQELASHQAGCFTRRQALDAGLTDAMIVANLSAHRWTRLHPGVLVGFTGPLPQLTVVWAALLAVGQGAVVTGSTALRMYGLTSVADDGRIYVAIDHSRRVVAPPGVVVRRRRRLEQVVHPWRTPPSVRVEEAVLQCAATTRHLPTGLGVIADACQQGLTSPRLLRSALDSLPKLRGRRTWSSVLDDVSSGARSFLEVSYMRQVERAHGLPTPMRQVAGAGEGGRRVWRDAEYPRFGVILELDGRLGHEWASDQLRDRRRDARAIGSGSITLRHGYADILEACETARSVGDALRTRGWTGRLQPCGPTCTAIG